jgi:hypothetical protein
MVKRRRRPELPPRWLTIGEVAQDLGHSPSWLRAERLNKGEKTGFSAVNRVIGQIDDEPTNNRSNHYREPRGQRDGPEHRQ